MGVTGGNVTQADGAPAFFGALDAETNMTTNGYINDSRQFQIPAEVDPTGAWQLAIGLDYRHRRPGAGGRRVWTDGWERAAHRGLKAQPPPTPDQTCALLPATCAAQN